MIIYIYYYINTYIYIFGAIHRSTAHCLICVTPEVQHPNIVAQDVLKAIVEYLSIDSVFLDKSACWIFAPRWLCFYPGNMAILRC